MPRNKHQGDEASDKEGADSYRIPLWIPTWINFILRVGQRDKIHLCQLYVDMELKEVE